MDKLNERIESELFHGFSLKDFLMDFLIVLLENLEAYTPSQRKEFIKALSLRSSQRRRETMKGLALSNPVGRYRMPQGNGKTKIKG